MEERAFIALGQKTMEERGPINYLLLGDRKGERGDEEYKNPRVSAADGIDTNWDTK